MPNPTGKGGFKKGAKKQTLASEEPRVMFFDVSHNRVHQAPIIDQNRHKSRPYVYFGLDNLFPQRLVEYYDNVNKHRELVDKTTRYVAGDGIFFEGDQADAATEWFEEATGGSKKWLKKVANDVVLFNGFYLNTLWRNDGFIEKLKHKDFTYVRSGIIEEESKKVEEYWLSANWKVATYRRNLGGRNKIFEPISMPRFNPDTFRDPESQERGQLWLIEDTVGTNGKLFYPEPSYMGALNWLDIDAKISDLHKNNLNNGMAGNAHIHLFEDLSDPAKRQAVENGINSKFGGSNNAGKIIVTWSTDPESKPMVNQIQSNNSHEMYKFYHDAIEKEIMDAHDVPGILANLETNTGLGGEANAMRMALEMWQSTNIKPRQNMITDPINKALQINGVDAEATIQKFSPVRFLAGEDLLREVMTTDEIRMQILGLEPLNAPEEEQITDEDGD